MEKPLRKQACGLAGCGQVRLLHKFLELELPLMRIPEGKVRVIADEDCVPELEEGVFEVCPGLSRDWDAVYVTLDQV